MEPVSLTAMTDETPQPPAPRRRPRPAATPSARMQQVVEALRAGQATPEEIREGLGLVAAHLAESDAWQLELMEAAKHGPAQLTWAEIGQMLGYPENSARQRALWRYRHLDAADPQARIRRSRRR